MAELTANDFRFTTKGDTIFAFVCGEPLQKVQIKAFSNHKFHEIKSVEMLGVSGVLNFSQTNDALAVSLPETLPSDYAVCLKIVPVLNLVPQSISKY